MSDLIDQMWNAMHGQMETLRRDIARQTHNSERAEYTDGIPAYAYADLPTVGLADGSQYITIVWVSNGRKDGEGAGSGTGVLAIWQQSAGDWLRVGDYASVAI